MHVFFVFLPGLVCLFASTDIPEMTLGLFCLCMEKLSDPSKDLLALQCQYEEAVQECEMERTLFNQDMAPALHAIFEHKEQLSDTIQRVHTHVSETTSNALTMVLS